MYRVIAAVVFASLFSSLMGCATTQQQQQQQQEETGDQGNEDGNVVNASLNQGNNGNEDNGFGNLNGGNDVNLMEDEGGNGEFVNNANGDATFDQGFNDGEGNMMANGGDMMTDNGSGQDFGADVNNATESEDFGAMNAQMTDPAVPLEQPLVDASVNGVVDESAGMGMGMGGAPMAGIMPGAGVVRYVMEGGTQLYADEQRTNAVKNLEQGDHPLVVENGEWARTSDGYYVSAQGLTSRPIGRYKVPADWQ